MKYWKKLDGFGDVWFYEHRREGVCMARPLVIRLKNGGLAIGSPSPFAPDEAHAELAELGPVKMLFSPNFFHNLGIRSHMKRYGESNLAYVAPPAAAPRLKRQTGFMPQDLSALRAELPSGVTIVEPPHMRTGEVWIRLESNEKVAWCVADGFFNYTSLPRSPFGVFLRFIGIASGFRISPLFKWYGVRNRQEYGKWLLVQVDADRPSMIVTSHGEIYREADLVERVKKIAKSLT